MKYISSPDNPQMKFLKKLANKKYRREEGKFFVENFVIIRDAIKGGYRFEQLFVTKVFISKNQNKWNDLLALVSEDQVCVMDEKLNASFSQLDTPSGITAVYPMRKTPLDETSSVIYLNGINDPGNLGTLMRTALAFGISNVVVDAGCVDIYNAKAISASREAIFKMNVHADRDGEWIRSCGKDLTIVVADARGGMDLADFDIQGLKRFCLILGSEAHGVSDPILERANEKVYIPISDKIESLNVSAAAAILLYHFKK